MKVRYWLYLLLTLVGSMNLAACDREGPAERTGEEVDEAGRAIRDSVDENRNR